MRTQVLNALSRAGLGGDQRETERIADSYPHQLSGGQLQRACIALATANNPSVLIADEPTTALDVTVQAEILDLLRQLASEGVAVLLITHDMGVVADVADAVAVMRHGRIIERGDVRTIFASPSHDYTRQLLAAVPRLNSLRGGAGSGAGAGDGVAAVSDAGLANVAAVNGDGAATCTRCVGLASILRAAKFWAWWVNLAQVNPPLPARSPDWFLSTPAQYR